MLQHSFVLETKDQRKDGTFPLKVQIYRSRNDRALVGLKIFLLPEQWDKKGEKIIGSITATADNMRLANYRVKLARLLLDIDESGKNPPMSEVRWQVEVALGQKQPKPTTFFSYYENHIPKITERKTRLSHESALNKAKQYDSTDRAFSDITAGWLRGFEAFCKNGGMATNAISVYLRNIRTIYNRAIDDGVAELNNYPFRRFKIKHEKTAKRALTVEQLRLLRDYPCEQYQKKYRDVFMLIFYLGGINMVDLFRLKTIDNGRIEYVRSKTGVHVSLKVQPEAMEIIERYRGTEHLLSMADGYANHEDFLHRMDKELKKIGTFEMVLNNAQDPERRKRNKKKITPLFPALSSYWARHSVATLMAELDIPDATIDRVLAHADNSIAAIYIKRNQQKVDDAMRRVIDFLNEKEGEPHGQPSQTH